MSTTIPDLESASARDVVAYAVEQHHPRLAMACSFQKEETVLAHMLSEITGDARIFTIDTGVLFPETIETWKRFEERFGLTIEAFAARSPDAPWTQTRCCGEAKVAALGRALENVDAWITGIRHEQAPTRAAARKLERDERRGIWEFNPLTDWSEKDIWTLHLRPRPSVQPCSTTRAMPRSAARRAPCRARAARVAGRARARPSAGSSVSLELSHIKTLEAESIFIMREVAAEFERPVLAVQWRQGLDRPDAPRREGLPPGRFPFPVMHVDTGPQFPRGDRVPRSARRASRRASDRREVQDSIDAGTVREEPVRAPPETVCRARTLLGRLPGAACDAAFGGARRDEERARAKERDLLVP